MGAYRRSHAKTSLYPFNFWFTTDSGQHRYAILVRPVARLVLPRARQPTGSAENPRPLHIEPFWVFANICRRPNITLPHAKYDHDRTIKRPRGACSSRNNRRPTSIRNVRRNQRASAQANVKRFVSAGKGCRRRGFGFHGIRRPRRSGPSRFGLSRRRSALFSLLERVARWGSWS